MDPGVMDPQPIESRLNHVLQHIADQISAMLAYWDSDQICLFANNAYRDWFGKTRDEMIGMRLETLLGPLYRLNLPFFQAAMAGQTQVFERAIPLPDGSIRHSIATYTPDICEGRVRGVIVHVADVTPIKQLEQTLREREQLYTTLFQVLPIGVTITDAAGRIRDTNPAAQRLLGLSPAEHHRRRIDSADWQIVRPDGSPMPAREYASVRALDEQRLVSDVEMGVRTPAGSTTWLSVTATPMPLPGHGVVVVYSDISQHTRMEQALRANLAEREMLLKEVHHRVKNNLQVVVSLLRLQSRDVSDPAAAEALRESRLRVEAMALVHELLYHTDSLATIDADTYVRQLGQQLAHTYALRPSQIAIQADAAGIALSMDQAVPCGLIINELLSNSFKYAFPSGRGSVGISLTAADQHLTLTVWDTGVGMPAQREVGRQTLGLKLVHDLARQLHGSVRIEGPPGTTVTITFPACTPAARSA